MTAQKQYLTQEGLEKLAAELEYLRTVRRAEAAERVRNALEMGGAEDNEYEEAKNEQAFVEGRIMDLEDILRNVVLIPEDQKRSGVVAIGSTVTVKADNNLKQTYKIVGSAEADAKEHKISNESPVGAALLGHRKGDTVEVQTPAGTRKLKIVQVE